MDFPSLFLCLLFAFAAIFLLYYAKISNRLNQSRLPPGPPPLPVFGNLFSLGSKPHVSLAELAKTYGPVMTLWLGQVPTVVITSPAAAKEVLQKNDLSFSNRTQLDALRAHNHLEKSVIFLPVSPQWRNLRRICNSLVFSTSRLESTQALRRKKVQDLILFIRKCSDAGIAVDFNEAASTTILNVLSTTFLSVDLGDYSSKLSLEYKNTVRLMIEELGKPNLADYFPILRRLDLQGIRRRMKVHFGNVLGLFRTIVDQRLQGVRPSDSQQRDDVLDALLGINHDEKAAEIDPSFIPHLLQDLFGAGTDTTTSTLEWAMAELLHNPEKLKKSQLELEKTIGKRNPVEDSHIPQLPYLQAVVKETLRLHPPAPLLLPRKPNSDVELFRFIVPKTAQVLVNVWAIGRDSSVWENPDKFEPERFLGSDIDVKGFHFELTPFGSGRRICPGMQLAMRMLHMMLGSLIHGFDWKLENGALPSMMDMNDKFGLTLEKAQRLRAIPVLN